MNQGTDKQMKEQNEEIEIDLLELFFYLKSKAAWLISAFLAGALFAGLITIFCMTPKYRATAKLYMVSASSDSIVDLTDLNLGTSLSEDYEELLKIRPIFEEVIEELSLSYTYEELLGMTTIATIGKTRLLAITAESTNPAEAKEIANCLADKAVTYVPEVMETSTPNIAEPAIIPEKKSSPSLVKNTMIGAVVFLLAAAAFFTVRLLMDDTFHSAEDVEKAFGVMPLTVIPEGMEEKKSRERRQKKPVKEADGE